MTTLTILTVATIVAGEVGGTVPAARLPVACTVVRDHARGRDLDARWYGRATPGPFDLAAARLALDGGCQHLPYFRFFGSPQDLTTWHNLHYIRKTDEIWTYIGPTGWIALGIVHTPNVDFVPKKNVRWENICPE